jgi:ribonuclease P protein component
MEHTLGKTERLHKRDFRCAQWVRSGKTPHFLLFKSKSEQTKARFGVVVSRRIRGAVKRNRIKRLLREYFRLRKEDFLPPVCYSVRVTAMPEAPTWDSVSREMDALIARAVGG